MTRPRRAILLICFAASIAATVIGAIVAPTLLAFHPLALAATSPLVRHLVLASDAPAIVFVAVAAGRRLWDSAISYEVGHIYGEQGLHWFEARYPGPARWTRRIEGWFQRAAVPVVFAIPGFAVGFLAGTAGMRRRVFLPVAGLGHVAWACGIYLAGDAMRPWIRVIVAFVQANAALLTVASVVGFAAIFWLRRTREPRPTGGGK